MTKQTEHTAGGSVDPTPFDEFGVAVSRGEPLSPHTWLGIGGVADWFSEPVDIDALARVVRRCQDQ